MDKWSDDQLKKMELGGNIKAKDFFEASPDFYQGMSIKEKYSSVFATQYKEKVIFAKKTQLFLHKRRNAHWHDFAAGVCLFAVNFLTNCTLVPLVWCHFHTNVVGSPL